MPSFQRPQDLETIAAAVSLPTSPPYEREHYGSIWQSQRILNIEGEGLAGLSALYILRELIVVVSELERRQGNPSSAASPLFRPVPKKSVAVTEVFEPSQSSILPYRPCHYFDFICGTSTGGLAAIMLGNMRFTIDETIDRCERIIRDITPSVPKASIPFGSWDRKSRNSGSLKHNLRLALEENDEMSDHYSSDGEAAKPPVPALSSSLATMKADEYMCKTIVFTTQKARKGIQRPFIFRSYRQNPESLRARNADCDTTSIQVVDACRAALSNPASFDSVRIGKLGNFRDASVCGINPAIEAYNEVRENNNADVQCLLTFGLGSCLPSISGSAVGAKERLENADRQLLLEAKLHDFRTRRFADVDLSDQPVSVDGSSSIRESRRRAEQYCRDDTTKRHLRSWAKRLVRYRKMRADTVRWHEYAGFEVAYPDGGEGLKFSSLKNVQRVSFI